MAKCEVCGANPATSNVALIRQNELGVDGIWRCESHNGLLVDPETQGIIDAVKRLGAP